MRRQGFHQPSLFSKPIPEVAPGAARLSNSGSKIDPAVRDLASGIAAIRDSPSMRRNTGNQIPKAVEERFGLVAAMLVLYAGLTDEERIEFWRDDVKDPVMAERIAQGRVR